MKYYLYISDAKVDMLLPQIPHGAKRKVATELGFDLKIFKASRKTEDEPDESRISRLETVVEYIRKYGKVGTIDEPDDFIDDTQMMWSGPDAGKCLAIFGGLTDRTVFSFAGSAHHLVGADANEETWPRGSALNSIVHWLLEHEDDRPLMHLRDGELVQHYSPDEATSHIVCALVANGEHPERTVVRKSRRGIDPPRPPQQCLEIFAKRLLFTPKFDSYWQQKEVQVLLGTPLYVAMTD